MATDNEEGPGIPSAAQPARASGAAPVSIFLLVVLGLFFLLVARMSEVGALFARLFVPLLVALAECLALVGLMHALRTAIARATGDREHGHEERPAHAFASDIILGYPLFGVLCYLVGLANVSAASMGALVATFALLGLWLGRQRARAAWPPLQVGLPFAAALGLLGIVFGIATLQAQLPAFSLDEIAYHLAVPRAWVSEGRVVALPLNSQSFYPSGIEAADLPFLTILGAQGAIASHVMHLIVALCTCLVLFAWLRRHTSDDGALVCVAAVASTPALILTAGWSWNEWPLLGICVLSLVGLEDFARTRASTARTLLSLGVPAAAGLLCKYTFVAFALPVLAACVLVSLREHEKRGPLLRAVLFACVLGLFFYARNLVLVGNPVEPFLSSTSPQISGFRSAARPRELLLSYVFDASVADEALGVALLALALSLAFSWRALREHPYFLHAGLGLWMALVVVTLLGPSSRILVPFLAGSAVVAFVALHRTAQGPRTLRAALWGTVLLAATQVGVGASLANSLAPYSTLAGKTPDRTFLLNFAGGRSSYPRVEWMDAQLPEGSRTLVVGLHQLYHFSHRVRGGGDFDGARVASYLDAASPEALYERLRKDGFTHVAVYKARVVTPDRAATGLKAELETVLTPEAMNTFVRFLGKHAKSLAAERNMEVFALR